MSFDWRALPSLSSLRAFDATARSGGFSSAARSLNVTHAAIAQQVRGLEKELDVQLVARMGRTVRLTEAGNRLADALDEGFATILDGVNHLRDAEGRRGLRIKTTMFIADTIIMPRLSEFWEQHPGVEIALLPSADEVDIVREGFDFAIRVGDGHWPGMDAIHLANSRLIAVGAPALLEKKGTDAAQLPWIWTPEDMIRTSIISATGVDMDKIEKIDLGGYRLCLEAARQGLGMTVASELIVRDDLATGRLIEFTTNELTDTDYYAVAPKGPRRGIATQFIDWLKTIF
ncbi:MAG: LysR substrate-binding domain-containing protein [Hyphomicrobiales bacterium]